MQSWPSLLTQQCLCALGLTRYRVCDVHFCVKTNKQRRLYHCSWPCKAWGRACRGPPLCGDAVPREDVIFLRHTLSSSVTLVCFKKAKETPASGKRTHASPFRQHHSSHLDTKSDHFRKETERPSGKLCVVLSEGQVSFWSGEQTVVTQIRTHRSHEVIQG